MSPEEKRDFEKKLVRRIDLTVLPSKLCSTLGILRARY